jgi:hypothetical protein
VRETREGFRERDEISVGPPPPILERDRERERRFGRLRDDDEVESTVVRERERSRERRRVAYDDDPLPPAPRRRSPPPPPRPGMLLRRQSSLDTFDRKPAKRYWERERAEEYGPPARRDEQRVPHYVDIPLPRTKALPPPSRGYVEREEFEREKFEQIEVSDPHRYGDDDFHTYPEKVREREVVRTRRRARSRDSRATSKRRGRSRSSSSSNSSSESGGTTLTARSEYPKKGKTRIPARLVSKRALIEIGYPYVEEVSLYSW